MDKIEFAKNQVEQIDRELFSVRGDIESLFRKEEFLILQRDKWLGMSAVDREATVVPLARPVLTLLQGGLSGTSI